MTVPSPRQSVLTVSEARRVVVDVAQVDGDSGGASQPPLVAPHVSGLEHDVVLVLRLPVHLGHSGADDTCGATRGGRDERHGSTRKRKTSFTASCTDPPKAL